MAWWQIVLPIVALAVLIGLVAAAYLRGREDGEQLNKTDRPADGDDRCSLFGDGLSVCDMERRLIEAMPDAMIVTNANGAVTYCSPAAERLGIMQRNRLDVDEIKDMLTQVAADGTAREREITVRLDPLRQGRGDATGRGVQAGQAPPSDQLHLQVRIGEIADDLYAIFLRDISEQRRFEAMRTDFVTNVSHELKTPSGAIMLLAETITDAADDPDAVRYFAGRIGKESRRLNELVQRLIELQRAQDAPSLVDARPRAVLDLVREAMSATEVQADAKHIDLVLSVNGRRVAALADGEHGGVGKDGDDAEADTGAERTDGVAANATAGGAATVPDAASVGDDADAGADHAEALTDGTTMMVTVAREPFTTAIKNLVENAIRYSPEHTTVSVGITERDGTVRIQVVDQGIGIPAESLGRIFERFYRVDPARSRETGGSGLGLAITKHCVQECGGTISVWSREGEGSTFTIELPSAASEQPAAE